MNKTEISKKARSKRACDSVLHVDAIRLDVSPFACVCVCVFVCVQNQLATETAKILEAAACASIDIGQCRAITGVMDKVARTHLDFSILFMYIHTHLRVYVHVCMYIY